MKANKLVHNLQLNIIPIKIYQSLIQVLTKIKMKMKIMIILMDNSLNNQDKKCK